MRNSDLSPTGSMHAHRKQFVLGPEVFSAPDHWHLRQLDTGAWLAYCQALRTAWMRDTEGAEWVLLGFAVETDERKAAPQAQVTRAATVDVPALGAGWAGRWILIGDGRLYLDAGGLLGCFYGQAPDGRTWISSSPALLLGVLFPGGAVEAEPRPLRYRRGLSWFTPPRSRFTGMSRLLPSQTLDPRDGGVSPRPPIDPRCEYEEGLARLERILLTTLTRLAEERKPLWLGLTGGFDSRLMLAVARRAGIELRPFTRVTARMSVADRVLPPRLARRAGYDHVFVRQAVKEVTRAGMVAEHTAGHVSDGDAQPFLHGVRDELTGISFGGHGFAVASGFRDLSTLPATVNDPDAGARMIAELFNEPPSSARAAGIRDWLTWALAHPQEHLDWRDRFFIEQRQAGWLSSKEQLYDLLPLERFAMLNAACTHALLLSLPPARRRGSQVQSDLIRRLAPELLSEPCNPPDDHFSLYRRFRVKLTDDPAWLIGAARRRLQRRRAPAA